MYAFITFQFNTFDRDTETHLILRVMGMRPDGVVGRVVKVIHSDCDQFVIGECVTIWDAAGTVIAFGDSVDAYDNA